MPRFIPARAGNARRGNPPMAPDPVHPRACGERRRPPLRGARHPGSSPRVRGTRALELLHEPELRFIPARAGNAAVRPTNLCEGPVHPRACGERNVTVVLSVTRLGSSPRVRGTPTRRVALMVRERFIPARAGNAQSMPFSSPHRTVHPRACGERRALLRVVIGGVGSSPRVRGTLRGEVVFALVRRFIPARAGNATRRTVRSRRSTVHPRACGERSGSLGVGVSSRGSSPRVRGTPQNGKQHRCRTRFIPARAGNASIGCSRSTTRAVHPRACGERIEVRPEEVDVGGSSPRVRGTPAPHHRQSDRGRFIPARAGNALHTSPFPASVPVHPRACGERADDVDRLRGRVGSSPRVRGTPYRRRSPRRTRRFIPARAGNAEAGAVILT